MRTTGTRAAALVIIGLGLLLSCARDSRAQPTEAARAAARAAETRQKPAKGSITGRVVGEGGEPLAHVAVQIRPRGVQFNAARSTILKTDEEGNFVAANLPPGAYVVWAMLPGYVLDPEQLGDAQQGHRIGDFVTVRMVRGGVITGTVTDSSGAPLAALGVSAVRVRDLEGRATFLPGSSGMPARTDDRGVYRIYGITPGVYLVVAGHTQLNWAAAYTPYEGDAPTFFPSATRDTAAEVTVRPGQEVVGIDIRYRDERGRRVTGKLALPAPADDSDGVNLTLTHVASGAVVAVHWVSARETDAPFSLDGVADGDYELQAQLYGRDGPGGASAPLPVTVRGADVTGLRLTLAPLASLSGNVVVEPAPESLRALPACKERAPTLLAQEVLVVARREARADGQPARRTGQAREAAPEASGAFTLRGLEPGAYRFEARPLDENFYAQPFQLPAGARPTAGAVKASATNAARAPGPVQLGAGQQLGGLSVRLAAGAAGVAGRVSVAESTGTPPVTFGALRVHLVPAERARADEPAFYYETSPTADGSFTLKHLAPGRYFLAVRPTDAPELPRRPAAWDADSRARLRREAEAFGLALDLQPCQRTNDLTLRYPHTPGK
jgi:hypothetical protein